MVAKLAARHQCCDKACDVNQKRCLMPGKLCSKATALVSCDMRILKGFLEQPQPLFCARAPVVSSST